MKMEMKHILLLSILLLSTSCMKVIDLEDLRPDPKLVLNSVASQGTPVTASLSRTWFYTENYPNVTIENARLKLYANDNFVEEMVWKVEESEYNSVGSYVSSYIPVAGDEIRIEAEKKGFKSVVGKEKIPGKPGLLKFAAEDIKVNNPYSSNYTRKRYKVTVKDDPAVVNCYMISIYVGSPSYEYDYDDMEKPPVYTGAYSWSVEYLDYASEPVFGNQISILDKVMGNDWLSGRGGRPFSDELFNGKEYMMKLDANSYSGHYPYYPQPEEQLPDSAKVYLYSISESYYKYLSALCTISDGSLNNDLADAGLAEPVRVFSNIEGGLGIMGAVCVDSLKVEVPKVN